MHFIVKQNNLFCGWSIGKLHK